MGMRKIDCGTHDIGSADEQEPNRPLGLTYDVRRIQVGIK